MRIYTHHVGQASRPAPNTPSVKRRAAFAREAAIDAFGPKAIHALGAPGSADRRPGHEARPLGKITAKVANDTGQRALRHWLNQAGRADSDEERTAALEIAGEIAGLMGLDADLIGRRAAR